MSTLQALSIFASGYAISRLVLRAQGHLRFVGWLLRWSGGAFSRVVLGVMLGAFALSTFVPNALTVLALIPVLRQLGAGEEGPPGGDTVLAMALVYGASVGGVGSLVGSPANLYLLVNLRLFVVPGVEKLHFISWMAFGMPLALSFLLACWALLHLTERRAMKSRLPQQPFAAEGQSAALLRPAMGWSLVWLTFWLVLLGLGAILGVGAGALWKTELWSYDLQVTVADLVASGFTVALLLALFVVPQPTAAGPQRLLRLSDLVREVPWRGVLLGLGVLVLLVVVAQSGLVRYLERVARQVIPEGVGSFSAALVLTLVTIFATELFNNTTVATVMFPLCISIGQRVGADPLLVMLGVSLASTCAFMTPVATPVNALVFGSLPQVSLARFVRTGLAANVIGALWIAVWLTWLIPPILRLLG